MVTPTDDDCGELLAGLGWVRRLAVALAGSADAADDLVQQAAGDWLRRRPAGAAGGMGLRRWLARVVRARAIDGRREAAARARREHAAGAAATSSADTAPADAIVLRLERQRRVAAAVHALDEPYRTAILHRFLEERSTRDVAALLDVPEATVRKRVERGLLLLRRRLDREFGEPPRTWLLLLLPPSGRAVWGTTGGGAAIATGMLMTSSKAMIGTAAVAAAAALAVWQPWAADVALTELGGHGVLVSPAVAAARAPQAAGAMRTDAAAPDLASAGPVATGPAGPRAGGRVLIDGEWRAPPGLAIEVYEEQVGFHVGDARCDAVAATWDLQLRKGADPAVARWLWITSAATVPAWIPLPAAAFAAGAFDLELRSGRRVALRFVDRASGAPLADLEFELYRAIETDRSAFRVTTRGEASRHRTDEDGRAEVTGLPDLGYASVCLDLPRRPRPVVMANGETMTMSWGGPSVWVYSLTADTEQRIEATIVCNRPLGPAVAAGTVPAWAVAGRDLAALRVVERTVPDPAIRGFAGDPFEVTIDGSGAFALQATAPSRHAVWLEARPGRERLSKETFVDFDHTGAHAPIEFAPLLTTAARLKVAHLPRSGTLSLRIAGEPGVQEQPCRGGACVLELKATPGATAELRVHADGATGDREFGYVRRITADELARGQLDLDLDGAFRTIELRGDAVAVGDLQAVALLPVRAGAADMSVSVLSPLQGGRGTASVLVPNGRWLWRAVGDGPRLLAGVAEVRAGDDGPLLLTVDARSVPRAELGLPAALDEVDGVSLRQLPPPLRQVPDPGDGDFALLPRTASWSPMGPR